MGPEMCDILKNFENPPEVGSLKIPDEPQNAPITAQMTETCCAREKSIFWAIFASFVTFPTHSKIPSVTRDSILKKGAAPAISHPNSTKERPRNDCLHVGYASGY
ncbi:hypothetical protein B0H19DRAFT_1069530 [Mycena capillaripes]|nr:hypothetical protein B0H19DRAFT_1069530 [Mycena capillaripes]